jgi:hypothetical protein
LSLDGGVVASRAQLDIQVMPADPNDWYFGVDASPLLRRVEPVATATVNGKTARSVSVFQMNSVGNYAINSWVVDPDHSAVATTVPSGTTTTTTNPSGATTTCTDPTKWAVSYWDNDTLTGDPADEVCEGAVARNWGLGGPAETDVDYFSGRWTKIVNFAPGNYEFTIGADDGVRMRVDGNLVYNKWVDKAYSEETVLVPLGGSHVIEIEYYERANDARLTMEWSDVPVCANDEPQWFVRYFNGTSLQNSKLRFERHDDSPNFDWGKGRPSEGSLKVGARTRSPLAGSGLRTSPSPACTGSRSAAMTAPASMSTAPR